MADIQFSINLDLVETYVPAENVTVVQEDDQSVKFLFTITNREQPVDLTGATNIVVSFVKPDGHLVLQNDATLVNGKVELIASPQAFTYVGKTYFQVQYKIGAATFNTRQAFLWVEKGHTSCQAVASTDFAPYLDNVVATGEMLDGLDLQALIDSKQTAENAQGDVNGIKPRVTALEVDVASLKARVASTETKNTQQDNRLTSLETSQATQDTKIASLESGQTDLSSRVTSVESNITTVVSEVDALQLVSADHESRIDGLEANMPNLSPIQADIAALKAKDVEQDGRIGDNELAISVIQTKNTQQDTAIAGNATSIATVDNKVTTNKAAQDAINTSTTGSIANHTSRIEALEVDAMTDNARITNLEVDNSSNKNRIATVEGAIGILNTDINDLQSNDGAQDSRLTAIETKNSQQDTAISGNTTAIANNKADADAKITGLTTRVGTAETDIAGLKTKDTQQDTRMTAIENKNNDQDTRLTAIEGVNATQNNRLTTLETDNTSNKNRLTTNEGNINTLTKRTSSFVNVKEFGAVGDGVVDDGPAFQLALTYIKNNGYGTLWVPNGIYKIGVKLRVYRDTKVLMSKGTVLKRAVSGVLFANGDDGENYNAYNGNGNIEFEGGIIDMQGSTVTTMGSAISIGHANGFTAKDLIIRDVVQAHGFDLCGVNNVLIDNVRFEGYFDPDNSRSFSEAIQIDLMKEAESFSTFGFYDQTPTINITVTNCYVGNSTTVGAKKWNRAVGSHSGTHDVFFKNIKITGNTFNTGDYAISSIKFDDVIIENNIIEDCQGGIRLMLPTVGGDTTDANGVQTNVIQPDRRYLIKGNIIKNTGTSHAVQVFGREPSRIDLVTIEGNIIDNTGVGSKGVNVTAANKVVINGNQTKNSTGVSISIDYCDDALVSSNVITDSVDAGMYLTFCKNFKIIGNIVTRSGVSGIAIKDSQYFEVEDNKIVDAGMNGNNTGQGLYLFTNVSEGVLTGNRVYSTNPSMKPTYGLRVTNTCSKMLRYNNFIKGSGATADMQDNSTVPYTVADLV